MDTSLSASPHARRCGLVLAAGYGSRHAVGTEFVPKPLLPVAGRPLILRALSGLELAGCSRAVVVLGHEGERIRAFLSESYDGQLEIDFVTNPHFHLENGVSVLAARDRLPDDFVLVMTDHVFEPGVLELVTGHRPPAEGATLVVDFKLTAVLDIADATKVLVENGRVLQIDRNLAGYNAVDCGLFLATTGLLDALASVRRERGDASLTEGVRRLAATDRMEALDLGQLRWQDVDTPAMLAAAERLVARTAGTSEKRRT